MPTSDDRQRYQRRVAFELFEPRLVMTASPLEIDYLVDEIEQELLGQSVRQSITLADAHAQTGVDEVRQNYGFDGTGQTVAIIDSGLAWDHLAFGSGYGTNHRVVGGWDFAENDNDPYDDGPMGSHGTHVAGILGAGTEVGPNSGVAPGVDLVALRVFDDNGKGYFQWVEQALHWVVENRNAFANPITAVNLSLGASWNASSVPEWAMLEDEFQQLEQLGIFISVAAGNAFASDPTPGLSYPAVSQYVVPVSSLDSDGQLSSFSQRHERAIAAPGRSITSAVPDYVGNFNGRTDDWSAYSGTSMAAPYVTGASVLIRQAMELAGYNDITQDDIYQVMRDTADSVYDAVTAKAYASLNVGRAIDSILSKDDYGSTVASGHSLGTLHDTYSIGGIIERLNDSDVFNFTAGASGTVSLSIKTTGDMSPHWQVSGEGMSSQGGATDNFSFEVVAGRTYSIHLASTNRVGHYTLETQLEASEALRYTDWGAVDFAQYSGINHSTAGGWYRIEASRTGLLTAEAFFDQANGKVGLQLYDSAGQNCLAAGTHSATGQRLDISATQGDVFFLKVVGSNQDIDFRLTNLVNETNGRVTLSGTTQDDRFSLQTGDTHLLSVNGVEYAFRGDLVRSFQLAGGTGHDTLQVIGSSGDDRAYFKQEKFDVFSTSSRIQGLGFETVEFVGGEGSDRAYFYDTAGDDVFVSSPQSSRMVGAGYEHSSQGVSRNYAIASTGYDTARLRDSTGDDIFSASPARASLRGSSYNNSASGFDLVQGLASAGNDRAILYGSAENEVLQSWSDKSELTGQSYWLQANQFDSVTAHGQGGADAAHFYDTAGRESYAASPVIARMQGAGFLNRAYGFASTFAYFSGGGDTARLYDSAQNDIFTGTSSFGQLRGDTYQNSVHNFEQLYVTASEGVDSAYLYGSADNDTLIVKPNEVRLYGSGVDQRLRGFSFTQTYASSGFDVARFYDSAGNDVFTGSPESAQLSGAGFHHRASGFEKVTASSSGGEDVARLYDSAGDDTLYTRADYSVLSGQQFSLAIHKFSQVVAYASQGLDVAQFIGRATDMTGFVPGLGRMSGQAFDNQAHNFGTVYVYSSETGTSYSLVGQRFDGPALGRDFVVSPTAQQSVASPSGSSPTPARSSFNQPASVFSDGQIPSGYLREQSHAEQNQTAAARYPFVGAWATSGTHASQPPDAGNREELAVRQVRLSDFGWSAINRILRPTSASALWNPEVPPRREPYTADTRIDLYLEARGLGRAADIADAMLNESDVESVDYLFCRFGAHGFD